MPQCVTWSLPSTAAHESLGWPSCSGAAGLLQLKNSWFREGICNLIITDVSFQASSLKQSLLLSDGYSEQHCPWTWAALVQPCSGPLLAIPLPAGYSICRAEGLHPLRAHAPPDFRYLGPHIPAQTAPNPPSLTGLFLGLTSWEAILLSACTLPSSEGVWEVAVTATYGWSLDMWPAGSICMLTRCLQCGTEPGMAGSEMQPQAPGSSLSWVTLTEELWGVLNLNLAFQVIMKVHLPRQEDETYFPQQFVNLTYICYIVRHMSRGPPFVLLLQSMTIWGWAREAGDWACGPNRWSMGQVDIGLLLVPLSRWWVHAFHWRIGEEETLGSLLGFDIKWLNILGNSFQGLIFLVCKR